MTEGNASHAQAVSAPRSFLAGRGRSGRTVCGPKCSLGTNSIRPLRGGNNANGSFTSLTGGDVHLQTMRRGIRILAGAALILVIAGMAPASGPCCAPTSAGSPGSHIALPPCCGAGCEALGTAVPRDLMLSAQAPVVASAPAPLKTVAAPPIPMIPRPFSPVLVAQGGVSSGPRLFLLHSQFRI
jgi:hypothetical protein